MNEINSLLIIVIGIFFLFLVVNGYVGNLGPAAEVLLGTKRAVK